MHPDGICRSPDVEQALAAGIGVVALETAVLTHGLPYPDNLRAMALMADAVREAGAVPAPIGVLRGILTVGLNPSEWEELLDGPVKCSLRDLAPVMVRGGNGGTTVAATAYAAHLAGLKVFATGGVGGVHRGFSERPDISADLAVLAKTPMVVVSAGVKSILDVGATVELLETLSVAVVGYRTRAFPGFYAAETRWKVPHTIERPEDAARIRTLMDRLGIDSALLTVQSPPNGLPAPEVEALVEDAIRQMKSQESQSVEGQAVTPFLLDYLNRRQGDQIKAVNVALLEANARLAGAIAQSF